MEFNDSERATEVARRIREFVDEIVLPVEREQPGANRSLRS